jgi:anti-sigma regulatory factor (Ser/Thr protein kinase)
VKRKQKFPESTSSVPLARQFVAKSLTAVAPELSETAALLVSELATNAVLHAESDFEVVVVYPSPSGRVRIEVSDRDKSLPTPSRPPPHVPHGRGLLLVSTLADEWGVQEPRGRAGKAVWFELTPTAASARDMAGTGWGRRKDRRFPRGLPCLLGASAGLRADRRQLTLLPV